MSGRRLCTGRATVGGVRIHTRGSPIPSHGYMQCASQNKLFATISRGVWEAYLPLPYSVAKCCSVISQMDFVSLSRVELLGYKEQTGIWLPVLVEITMLTLRCS